ncbi:MAG TPA: hypothetical protein VKU39_13075 [Streptosporangiaceae bacterium]|nr:hypothetical protein [Streptosporangiaceae bacterium]
MSKQGPRPELIIAAIAIAVTGIAATVMSGWPGLAVTVTAAAAIGLVVTRGLLPGADTDAARKAVLKRSPRPLSGYSRRRFTVVSSLQSRGYYEQELRPVLENLLAARLAERHGVNLYTDPDQARRIFCRGRRDAALWTWIQPREAAAAARRGIPAYTLARLIDRLEHL